MPRLLEDTVGAIELVAGQGGVIIIYMRNDNGESWQMLCSWTIMEAEAYLQYIDSVARNRSRKQWTLDMSWLSPLGVPVPEISAIRPHP